MGVTHAKNHAARHAPGGDDPVSGIAPAAHGTTHNPGGTDAVTTAAPGNSAVADTAAAGTATSLARSDHRHGREGFGTPGAVGTANAGGAATTEARADHTHKLQGPAIQSASASSAPLAAAASADVVLTWPTAFADTGYKAVAVAAYTDGTNRAPPTWYLKLNAADAPTTTTITVRVTNNSAVAEVVTVHAIGIKD